MFILRIPGRKAQYTLTEQLHVSFYRRTRATGQVIGGMFREMEDAGIDKDVLTVVAAHEQPNKPVSSYGRSPQRYWHTFRRRLDSMREHVRVVQEKNLLQIKEYDELIAFHQGQIAKLRSQRHESVQKAWRAAKPASLAELTAQAEERAENKGRLRGEVTT